MACQIMSVDTYKSWNEKQSVDAGLKTEVGLSSLAGGKWFVCSPGVKY